MTCSTMTFSSAFERLVRSRLIRLLLALVLIVVGVWAFLPNFAYRVASSAFVNAELVRVTAPIAGRLSRDLPRKGDIIEHSITVNLIEAFLRTGAIFWILSSEVRSRKTAPILRRNKLPRSIQ